MRFWIWIAASVRQRRTTLIFVNTRRLAERTAHLLGERLGDDAVAAHHGSLSKRRREQLEAQLRAGEMRALVATASLELGIDVGPVELVCQIGSPRSLATFLQRVGRSGHSREGVPVGRLFPTSRDELVESAAVLRGVRAGHLDRLNPSRAPLDILAQQMVAACAAEPWEETALYDLVRRAAPFAGLSRRDFDDIVELLSEGVHTGRGRRGAYLHRDRVNGMLRARRGARIAALTSGGAIPETADYRVVADPDETTVGNRERGFRDREHAGRHLPAREHLVAGPPGGERRGAGGRRPGRPPDDSLLVRRGAEPQRRTLCRGVRAAPGRGRATGGRRPCRRDPVGRQRRCPCATTRRSNSVCYLDATRTALGVVPTQHDIALERFFDEAGGMQLVVHAPLGGRINRGLGLALRKRLCATFDFELQGAANDDSVLLSLGPQHSFPLDRVPRFLSPKTVGEALTRGMLLSPMFTIRWRWNLGRALFVLRWRGGRRNPPPIQRMEADDLMAAIFPGLAQCQENATGPIEIPDHPLVRQTVHDCLYDAADLPGLVRLLEDIDAGRVRVHLRDTTEPSPLSHEILNSRPPHLSRRRAARGAAQPGGGAAPRSPGTGSGARSPRPRRHRRRSR